MQEQPRRKQRIPLSPEELFYVIEIKKIKQVQKLEKFKATGFYKITNRFNIFLAGFLTYSIVSIFTLSTWKPTYILSAKCDYGSFNKEMKKRTIAGIQLHTTSGEYLEIRTDDLYEIPKRLDEIFVGKDLLFRKTLKAKLLNNEQVFWTVNSYASLTVCCFALIIGFFIYKVNMHLTVNGLLMTTGLFSLASLYFILI